MMVKACLGPEPIGHSNFHCPWVLNEQAAPKSQILYDIVRILSVCWRGFRITAETESATKDKERNDVAEHA